MPCLVTLSQKELHRLEAVQKIRERRLSVLQAAELLHLSRSQMHRLLQTPRWRGSDRPYDRCDPRRQRERCGFSRRPGSGLDSTLLKSVRR